MVVGLEAAAAMVAMVAGAVDADFRTMIPRSTSRVSRMILGVRATEVVILGVDGDQAVVVTAPVVPEAIRIPVWKRKEAAAERTHERVKLLNRRFRKFVRKDPYHI
jgi:hypothetical protein